MQPHNFKNEAQAWPLHRMHSNQRLTVDVEEPPSHRMAMDESPCSSPTNLDRKTQHPAVHCNPSEQERKIHAIYDLLQSNALPHSTTAGTRFIEDLHTGICVQCRLPVPSTQAVMHSDGKSMYHRLCLQCCHCMKPLNANEFLDYKSLIFCISCYNTLLLTRDVCGCCHRILLLNQFQSATNTDRCMQCVRSGMTEPTEAGAAASQPITFIPEKKLPERMDMWLNNMPDAFMTNHDPHYGRGDQVGVGKHNVEAPMYYTPGWSFKRTRVEPEVVPVGHMFQPIKKK